MRQTDKLQACTSQCVGELLHAAIALRCCASGSALQHTLYDNRTK